MSATVDIQAAKDWLPTLYKILEESDSAKYYPLLEDLVVDRLAIEQGQGLVGRIIGVYAAWHLRRWRVKARIQPAHGKAAKEVGVYLMQLSKGDADRAVQIWAQVLGNLDQVPSQLRGKSLLQINKQLDQILVQIKAYHVASPETLAEYWRQILSYSTDKLRDFRNLRAPGQAADARPFEASLLIEIDPAERRKHLRYILRSFELATKQDITELSVLNANCAIIEQQYDKLTIPEVGNAFAQAAAGDIKAWAHRQGYNINRILGEFRRQRQNGYRR